MNAHVESRGARGPVAGSRSVARDLHTAVECLAAPGGDAATPPKREGTAPLGRVVNRRFSRALELAARCAVGSALLAACGGKSVGQDPDGGTAHGQSPDGGTAHDSGYEPDPDFLPTRPGTECARSSDCELVVTACCLPCGEEAFASAFTALSSSAAAEYRREACGSAVCEACASSPPGSFVALCSEHGCAVTSAESLSGASECSTDSDCSLRAKTCCECESPMAPGDVIAVSSVETYQRVICDGAFAPCPVCQIEYPPDVSPMCVGGRCRAVDARPRR
ncbi:MAG: hypothetical protein FJ104_08345 [Deltaproteobacteria bacterium]|nr:hypothetical protein [Deltaproteobacteria bacterium]